MAMSLQPATARVDRSTEFFAIADARCGGNPPRRKKPPRSALANRAAEVGRGLHVARGRIEHLERLSKGTTLFNDPVAEIDQLKIVLKQELTHLSAAMDQLVNAPSSSRQAGLHRDAVVASLKGQLAGASSAFQEALAQREASLSARELRAAKLASVAHTPSLPPPTLSALHRRPVAHARNKVSQNGRPSDHRGAADLEGGGAVALDMDGVDWGEEAQQQQTFWAPRSLREREAAMNTMQSTLSVG
mmetsp:Transcript_15387/g.41340  ORF Transcript_15387/g.41340 Transcript_15387/m.41340 type:complete len:246 (+) Transcript_15387:90-827(+)